MADILSVGIDIGTSTTQVIFSKISLEDLGGYFSVPQVSIVDKEVLYKSKVYLTPMKTSVLIDGVAISKIVAEEYRLAGYTPQDTQTGAVIITGESARKENAAEVLAQLSNFAGEFVVSTAGPDLESIIAGKGSGAFQYSIENGCSVVNLDIGGGTTNIVMFRDGDVVSKGCFDIGGRLIRLQKDLTIDYISPAVARIAEAIGIPIREGVPTDYASLTAITDKMADLLAQALALVPRESLLRQMQSQESSWFHPVGQIQAICFSGGVADCILDCPDSVPYGDIGALLGKSIAKNQALCSLPWLCGSETIRATVVGAGTYTTSISGSTIAYAQDLLPMKNIPIYRLTDAEQDACFLGESESLMRNMIWFLNQIDMDMAAVALTGRPNPTYSAILLLAQALANGLDSVLGKGKPLIVLLEHDIAKVLGVTLQQILQQHRKVICIDSVKVEQGDYVDLGRPVMRGIAIPLVVKTLLFG